MRISRYTPTLFVCACLLLTSCDSSSAIGANSETIAPARQDATGAARGMEQRSAANTSKLPARAVIERVMAEQYGDRFDPERNCWQYSVELNGIQGNYCMAPAQPEVVRVGDETRLFFYAANRSEMGAGSPYSYSATEPGLMGAFALRLAPDGAWTYVASEKAMSFGTAGNCGCDKAQFIKLDSRQTYGWLFTSGGIWQGIVVSNYSIVAPVGRRFRDLSAIPDVSESDQGATHAIKVIATTDAKGLYPLRVIRQRGGRIDREMLIEFDPARGVYALPPGQ